MAKLEVYILNYNHQMFDDFPDTDDVMKQLGQTDFTIKLKTARINDKVFKIYKPQQLRRL